MTLLPERLRATDADVHVRYTVTDATGEDNDFTPVVDVTGDALDPDDPPANPVTAEWETVAGPTRTLRVPLYRYTGTLTLWLRVPGGNDVYLGTVVL
jgi:hypothetical protein